MGIRIFLVMIFAALFIPSTSTSSLAVEHVTVKCGNIPIVWNHTSQDAYFDPETNKIYLSVDFMKHYSPSGQRAIAAHECGHAKGIYNELKADRYSVKVGKKDGWFTQETVNELCGFFKKEGTPRRCTLMQMAFDDPKMDVMVLPKLKK